MNKITLELTNNQAVHLWGMMIAYNQDTRKYLASLRVFNKDGTPNKNRVHYSELQQEMIDNLALSELVCKHLENFIELAGQATKEQTE